MTRCLIQQHCIRRANGVSSAKDSGDDVLPRFPKAADAQHLSLRGGSAVPQSAPATSIIELLLGLGDAWKQALGTAELLRVLQQTARPTVQPPSAGPMIRSQVGFRGSMPSMPSTAAVGGFVRLRAINERYSLLRHQQPEATTFGGEDRDFRT
ncbi:hypothetical protein CPLU01_12362 [Colletotrichum plurivorum]|uniref:Uncharacterized protein n=1 Tax=Colletotrichum plurivorum TaxID=2175906 RepID=A0A8H6JYX3_9PEZI|nr:hypothetical protein CPLU01_12362 [Colletotrichum plurivorum]